MGFVFKRKMYDISPDLIQHAVSLVPFGWIAGSSYRRVIARQKYIDTLSALDVRRYQENMLGEMLSYATKNVPFYQTYRNVVEALSPFKALKEFPILDKETIQRDFDKFLPKTINRIPHYEISTGGTSGNQLKFYVEDNSQAIDLAFVHRVWSRIGYCPSDRKATFRGVAFAKLKKDEFWQNNPIYNEIQFSPFHMTEKNLNAYFNKFIEYRPKYIHGYPSAIDTFAEYILRNNLRPILPNITAAFLVSEGFNSKQRERIETAFRTRVFSFYGHSERLILGGECEFSHEYHHFPDYGILEILSDDGSSCDKEGMRGELVGTGLLNRAMPLIRYRTGDYATRCEASCECGRHWDRFTEVEGRWKQDMIIGHDSNRISIAALNMHGPLFDRVVRYQYVQEAKGSCRLNLMVSPYFTNSEKEKIKKAYIDKTGMMVDWEVNTVDNIPLTERGKLKLLKTSL